MKQFHILIAKPARAAPLRARACPTKLNFQHLSTTFHAYTLGPTLFSPNFQHALHGTRSCADFHQLVPPPHPTHAPSIIQSRRSHTRACDCEITIDPSFVVAL